MNKRDIKSIKANLAKGFQKDWFGGDCLVSHWFNAISMLLPRAEQFSLDTIGKFGDGRNRSIDNRAADIQKFFLDETIHGSLHQVYNDTLAEYGYENWIASSLEKSIRHQNKHRSAIVLVSMIAGFEHRYCNGRGGLADKNP